MKPPKIIKPNQQTTPDQRRHAIGLLKSLSVNQNQQRQMTIKIGDTQYKIVIDKSPLLIQNLG